MTTPIAFTMMNRAAVLDAADMPHVLGDPIDVAWQGTAERVNANFGAAASYINARLPVTPTVTTFTGTQVFTVTHGTLTSASAWIIQFSGTGQRFIQINARVNPGGPPSVQTSDSTGAFTPTYPGGFTFGNLSANIPQPGRPLRFSGHFYTFWQGIVGGDQLKTYAVESPCGIAFDGPSISFGGVSAPNYTWQQGNGASIDFVANYFA